MDYLYPMPDAAVDHKSNADLFTLLKTNATMIGISTINLWV